MKITFLLLLFSLFSISAFAQRPAEPPYTTPPTFPQERQRDKPPDTKAPAPGQMSSAEVEDAIQKEIAKTSALKNADIRVLVDDHFVVLEGTATGRERDLAMSIAQSHAGERKVMDKLEIKQRT